MLKKLFPPPPSSCRIQPRLDIARRSGDDTVSFVICCVLHSYCIYIVPEQSILYIEEGARSSNFCIQGSDQPDSTRLDPARPGPDVTLVVAREQRIKNGGREGGRRCSLLLLLCWGCV